MCGFANPLTKMRIPPLATRILRHLRLLPSPDPTPLQATDTLWLYDNVAYPTTPNHWSAEFIAAYFHRNSGEKVAAVVADIAEKLHLADGDVAEATIAQRVQPFLDIILESRTVDVNFAGAGTLKLGPSGEGGVSVNELPLPSGGWKDGMEVTSTAILPSPAGPDTIADFRTRFMGPEGWAVVSDIDDTIKVTEVRDRLSLLRHTFTLPPEAVGGMPEAYDRLDNILGKPPFFYLSASPYNLFLLLRQFVRDHYPYGQLLLREMSWQDLTSFIASITVGTQQYKEQELERLLKYFPRRKWVFIGDSTQKDPEAYATAYKKSPQVVKKIWIRVVKGVDENIEKELNSAARFEKAFKGVPRNVWGLFEDPSELVADAEVVIASHK